MTNSDLTWAIGLIESLNRDEIKIIQKAVNSRKSQLSTGIVDKKFYTSWDLAVATKMEASIRRDFKGVKPKTRKQLENWASDLRKLRDIDGHDYETVLGVIAFSRNDEFWKKNILSAGKLRKNFDTLLVAKISKENDAPKNHVDLSHRTRKVLPVERTVVDTDSDGYKKFKLARDKLARKKEI